MGAWAGMDASVLGLAPLSWHELQSHVQWPWGQGLPRETM